MKHFEHPTTKQLKLSAIRRWADYEGSIVAKAAVGGQHMQMGIGERMVRYAFE